MRGERWRAALALAGALAAPAVLAAPVERTGGADRAALRPVAAALQARAHGALARFYAARGYWPLWIEDHGRAPAGEALLALVAQADRDGLDPDQYRLGRMAALLASARTGDAAARAEAELALSALFARYVRDMRRAPKARITYLDAELKPGRPAPEAILRQAALAPALLPYIARMEWMDPLYTRLRTADPRALDGAGRRRLAATLDRLRLLPGPWVRHITVDAASARLFYYDKGRQQGMMRVVVGTPETPTPMLAGMVRYAILNPYWNVPPDLVQRRIAPKMVAGASLAALRFEALSDWSASPARLDPRGIDWRAVAAGRAEVRLRQLPGGANAMGRVKFIFPNDQGIYLHDTPQKALMAKADRHLSNGCVRLEDAPRLARWLMGTALPAKPGAAERPVALAPAVPVYLTYATATPTPHGVALLADPYGRDPGAG
ncbi:L,D-transpeptidase family protein [Sphingomonas morindae]|uniref:L,D-transpeptidase family protein n=1 Tax=Sphingomonas morindae TaxID=1541170 RepID=A0ABY4X506_9SPHN|nr:L,D-transpeptidase family protein [Sphingomonas morindae]USI71976.1 L,D-transpeptidase family protein [Sphingomonas morindae]